MNCGLDTSILLRLLTGQPEGLAAEAVARLETLWKTGGCCAVSDMVLAETYYAAHFHYGVEKQDVLDALRTLSLDDRFRFSDQAKRVLNIPDLARSKPGFVDRLIHQGYQSEGILMYTCEKAAARLGDVVVIRANRV
ncbi:MAG: PIN domain-containing protein [Kiritimatiellia bacterium]|jgi:predicted nucleic-acid-binding protein|nr:PIN domain-containing protein [Kiritimatiellia bacterium]